MVLFLFLYCYNIIFYKAIYAFCIAEILTSVNRVGICITKSTLLVISFNKISILLGVASLALILKLTDQVDDLTYLDSEKLLRT